MERQTAATEPCRQQALPIVFGATLLLGATLLFLIQPLVARLLLPLLGGTPSVWNTVLVFFQMMLLAGYAYAHFSFQLLGMRYQPLLHFALIVLALLLLPFSISGGPSEGLEIENPAFWVLLTLLKMVGIPVLVLASTAPLLQKWFTCSRHAAARDPYFLYAASNVGSFGALFAYPLLVEPWLPLHAQVRGWSGTFYLLAALIALCAFLVRGKSFDSPETPVAAPIAAPSRWQVLKWMGLSFVPSSLMLGVTSYITTDIASVPLLWVLPLGLYLFTFVIAFSRHSKKTEVASSRAIPIFAFAVVFPMLVQGTDPVLLIVALHLLFFLFAALQCHLKLANSRPPAAQLTQFYLYLSIGGVMGGIFTALIAPVIFSSVIEYPLMILVATLIGFPSRAKRKPKFSIPPVYGGAVIVLAMIVGAAIVTNVSLRNVTLGNFFAGIFLLLCFLLIRRPVRYTIALATLLVCTGYFREAQSRVLERERNFFGILRVTDDSTTPVRRLYHGTTVHGMQFTTLPRRCEPLSYYHAQGPVGEISRLFEQTTLPRKVALVGVGAGAMISFSKPDQHWTLYEIDPGVVRIAQNTNYFTYLSHCASAPFTIELGDARLRLREAPDGTFGIIYLDAFSSDVIPMHLVTIEALKLYQQKLTPNGILALHLSNRNFELAPLIANLSLALGLQCFESTEGELNRAALAEGGFESQWVILVTNSLVPSIVASGTWARVVPDLKAPFWTDDFSSILRVLRITY